MANESRTGGRSRAARQASNEGNGQVTDSTQGGGFGFAWRTCGELKTGAELLEGVAQDWRDVANEATDGGDLVRRLVLSEPRADVELLRALARTLAETAGVHIEPSECGATFDDQDAIGCVRAAGHRGPCLVYRAGAWLEFFRVEPMPAASIEQRPWTEADQAGGELARLVELTDQGHDIDRARAILAREAGARLSPAIDETRANFGAALKGWARDTIAAYRSTRSAADLADIAHNADPRD